MKFPERTKGAAIVSMAILLGLIAILAIAGVTALGNKVSQNFADASESLTGTGQEPTAEPEPETDPIDLTPEQEEYFEDTTVRDSCDAAYQDGGRTDGYYRITANGRPVTVFCHMFTSPSYPQISGGYTLIALQYESNPVPWGQGVTFSPEAKGFPTQSFSLSPDQIPEHTLIGFGGTKDKSTTAIVSPTPIIGIRNINMAEVITALRDGPDYHNEQYNWAHEQYSYIVDVKHGAAPKSCRKSLFHSLTPEEAETVSSLYISRSDTGNDIFWQFNQNMPNPNLNGACIDIYNHNEFTGADPYAWGIFVK